MDTDLELKARLGRVFWELGFYTRLEVKLAGYSPEKKAALELTDVDVLGIRTAPDLSFEFVVADCTGAKHVLRSPIQRVFWLRGVMDFFGASKGYLCLATRAQLPEVQRMVASGLGVTILNLDNLDYLEKRTVPPATRLSLGSADSWQYFEGNISTLPSQLAQILELRKYRYWLTPQHDRTQTVVSLLSAHKDYFKPDSKFSKVLSLDLLSLFSLSVLQMSSYALRVNPENPEAVLRSYFYGGFSEMKRREAIVENIRRILSAIPTEPALFNSRQDPLSLQLDPPYLPRLLDAAFRMLNRPFDAAEVPRYLELVLFEKALCKGANQQGIQLLEHGFTDFTKKLARDLAKLLADSTGIAQTMFDDL